MNAKEVNAQSRMLRDVILERREEFFALLEKYGASNPRFFGSVARGDASTGSDIDILVDMDPAGGNILMRASGLLEETRELYSRVDIDIFPRQVLKSQISAQALQESIAV